MAKKYDFTLDKSSPDLNGAQVTRYKDKILNSKEGGAQKLTV
jgi:hypothetical protein